MKNIKKLLAIALSLVLVIVIVACDLAKVEDEVKKSSKKKDHEHTFHYIAYETAHFKQYTCGCPSPEIAEMHYDHDNDDVCDACGQLHMHAMYGKWQFDSQYHWAQMGCNWEICDIDPALNEHLDEDMDDKCDVCGYEMLPPPTPTNHFLRNQSGCEWMNEISADDVVSVKITKAAVGVAPGNFSDIFESTSTAAARRIFEQLYWVDTTPIDRTLGQVSGGSATTFQFTLKDGTERTISFNNGNYEDISRNYFRLAGIPGFNDTNEYVSYYGFATKGECVVYRIDGSCENPEVGKTLLRYIEFAPLTDDISLDADEPEYYIECSFGRLYFIKDCYFYINGDRDHYYQLVNETIGSLMNHSISTELYKITMNDEDWLYGGLLSRYKAGDTVTVRISMATDTGYLFLVNGEKINCSDFGDKYWEFTFTMPACDVVIDFKTYDGFLPHWNYSVLIETYWLQNLDLDRVSVKHYYGECESGAIVAMMETSAGYDAAIWTEEIDDTVIRYNSSNRILVLYDGVFYTLTDAYCNGLITPEELAEIANLHEEFYTYLYK